MSTKLTWIVEGDHTIHCGGCVKAIQFSLSRLPGVQQVTASYQTQRIEVDVTTLDAHDSITEELHNLGYQIKETTNHDDTNNEG